MQKHLMSLGRYPLKVQLTGFGKFESLILGQIKINKITKMY